MPMIALAGMIGSGKSSLTKSIAEHLNTGYALVGRPITSRWTGNNLKLL